MPALGLVFILRRRAVGTARTRVSLWLGYMDPALRWVLTLRPLARSCTRVSLWLSELPAFRFVFTFMVCSPFSPVEGCLVCPSGLLLYKTPGSAKSDHRLSKPAG